MVTPPSHKARQDSYGTVHVHDIESATDDTWLAANWLSANFGLSGGGKLRASSRLSSEDMKATAPLPPQLAVEARLQLSCAVCDGIRCLELKPKDAIDSCTAGMTGRNAGFFSTAEDVLTGVVLGGGSLPGPAVGGSFSILQGVPEDFGVLSSSHENFSPSMSNWQPA
jgi:hypothetical protein